MVPNFNYLQFIVSETFIILSKFWQHSSIDTLYLATKMKYFYKILTKISLKEKYLLQLI